MAGRSALATLQTGDRIYGLWAVRGQGSDIWTGVTFPVPAPTPVDSFHVVYAGSDGVAGAGCTGSTADPVSAPGFVCIYTNIALNTATAYGWGARCRCGDPTATGDGAASASSSRRTGRG